MKKYFFILVIIFCCSSCSPKLENDKDVTIKQKSVQKVETKSGTVEVILPGTPILTESGEQINPYELDKLNYREPKIKNRNNFYIENPAIATDQKDIIFYLVGKTGDDFSQDIGKYLVPIKFSFTGVVDIEDRISGALSSIFSMKTKLYRGISSNDDHSLRNMLYKSDLKVKEVLFNGEQFSIYLSGSLVSEGALMSAFIKPQINKTIQEYTKSYKVFLNGSEEAWRCALDTSGECK